MNAINRSLGALGTVVFVSTVFLPSAFAGGFEKSIVWGGRSAGLAGIGTPWAQGAEALYFNPAGLAGDKEGRSLIFDVSPTSSQFTGPINNNNDEVSSTRKLSSPLAMIYGATVNESFGYGVGAFVSGGAQAYFDAVDFSAASGYKPEVKTDLQITEVSAGAGYKIDDKFRLGLAWRFVMAQADFSFVKRATSPTATSFVSARLTGLKDSEAMAFRFGAQYKASESTELGLSVRSEVNFEASGKVSGQVVSPSTALPAANPAIAEADATARTTFPMAIVLGVQHANGETWKFLAEYAWTQYSRVGEIPVDTTSTIIRQTSLQTDWRDQHGLRFAAEDLEFSWPIRFGYGFTSAVTNPDYARASFTPPGAAHTLTVGTGQVFELSESDRIKVDAAAEYTRTSGEVSGKAAAGTATAGNDTRNGNYSASAFVVHVGLAYLF